MRRRVPVTKRMLYASLGEVTRAPIGWVEFCAENPGECRGGASQPRDIVMTQTAWRDLLRVNRWVNETIKPMTDMDHWGVIEKWSIPTDGYGDCEDYVLLKRKMLIDAGWPREALLITVVRDKQGRRPRDPDREDRQGRVHSRQPERERRGLDRDRIPLRQASIAERSECLGLARRHRPRSPLPAPTTDNRNNSRHATRSHPHPSPSQTGSRAASSPPRAGRNFLGMACSDRFFCADCEMDHIWTSPPGT